MYKINVNNVNNKWVIVIKKYWVIWNKYNWMKILIYLIRRTQLTSLKLSNLRGGNNSDFLLLLNFLFLFFISIILLFIFFIFIIYYLFLFLLLFILKFLFLFWIWIFNWNCSVFKSGIILFEILDKIIQVFFKHLWLKLNANF